MTLRIQVTDRDGILLLRSATFDISYHPLSGSYSSIEDHSSAIFRTQDGYSYGTFDLKLIDSSNMKTISLTDGRFHAYYGE